MIFILLAVPALLILLIYLCSRLHSDHQQNAPAKQETLCQPVSALDESTLQQYVLFWQRVMRPFLAENFAECELSKPGSLQKHMPPPGYQVMNYPRYGIVYQYDIDRKSDVVGNLREGLRRVYSPIDRQQIAQRMNNSFLNYSIYGGYGSAYIREIQELHNGRIRLVIGR